VNYFKYCVASTAVCVSAVSDIDKCLWAVGAPALAVKYEKAPVYCVIKKALHAAGSVLQLRSHS
jgi:hypothetical protein